MTTINFFLRLSTKNGRYPGRLSLRVIHNRMVKSVALPCHLYPQEWDAERQTVIFPENDPVRSAVLQETESRIAAELAVLKSIITALEKLGQYTAADIMGKYRRRRDESKLLGWAESLAMELTKAGQYRLARAFRSVSNRLVKYNSDRDIPLTHINASLIKGFENELMITGKKPNTISYYMRNLRSIYNKAVAAKRIPIRHDDPFAGVYTKVKTVAKRALSIEETTRLYEIDFDSLRRKYAADSPERQYVERLYHSWRLFMFCFFAQGMCFIDLAYLIKKENIRDGVCSYYRRKTKQQVEAEVNGGMRYIIESFAGEVKSSPYLFPIIAGEGEAARRKYESALRTQNNRLKTLSKLADIDRKVTTHVARHTYFSSHLKTSELTACDFR